MNVTLGKKLLSAVLCGPLVALDDTDRRQCGHGLSVADQRPRPRQIIQARARPKPLPSYRHSWPPSHSILMHSSPRSSALQPFPTRSPSPTTGSRPTRPSPEAHCAQAVDKQTWDPSVKALTQFPSVLDKMAQSLAWTSSLGEAYHNQQADVMKAVQTLRAEAQKAGNLKSGPQITVVQQSPQTIVIQPTNPQVVYVPEYNPTVVYGTPLRNSGIQHSRRGRHRSDRLRSWIGNRRHDERRLWLGIQLLGLQLVRRSSLLSRRRLLR